jgi:hypothetical protein
MDAERLAFDRRMHALHGVQSPHRTSLRNAPGLAAAAVRNAEMAHAYGRGAAKLADLVRNVRRARA